MWATIISGVIGYFSKRAERKDRIKEAKTIAEERRIEKGMDNSGWKDEWIVLLISFPYVMAFIPHEQTQEAAKRGFALLETFPEWWKISFISIVGAVFGIKKLLDWKGGMK